MDAVSRYKTFATIVNFWWKIISLPLGRIIFTLNNRGKLFSILKSENEGEFSQEAWFCLGYVPGNSCASLFSYSPTLDHSTVQLALFNSLRHQRGNKQQQFIISIRIKKNWGTNSKNGVEVNHRERTLKINFLTSVCSYVWESKAINIFMRRMTPQIRKAA